MIDCPECNGSGERPLTAEEEETSDERADGPAICKRCKGEGQVAT